MVSLAEAVDSLMDFATSLAPLEVFSHPFWTIGQSPRLLHHLLRSISSTEADFPMALPASSILSPADLKPFSRFLLIRSEPDLMSCQTVEYHAGFADAGSSLFFIVWVFTSFPLAPARHVSSLTSRVKMTFTISFESFPPSSPPPQRRCETGTKEISTCVPGAPRIRFLSWSTRNPRTSTPSIATILSPLLKIFASAEGE
mmetsp:Transcript_28350/g.91736  ORF Transcript_28350/g.91736 Transcript_28350/m.91736 type:complete len:200 (+) Transcript_28350:2007-2606(+)